ncbi:MAG: FHA domain-containing protein [Acidobacteriota bacterium]|nr:FHA domain-containing protein [Acidobacteriota bacterium]
MPRLRIQERNEWRDITIQGPRFTIGRARECDHHIDSGYISRRHCEIFYDEGDWHIRDFGSTLGTEVNGELIETSPLEFGDTVKLAGKIDAVFMADIQVANTETLRVVQPDVHHEGERLLAMNSSSPHRSYDLKENLIRVGRDETNNIHLPADTISSFHAELTKESGKWVLRDLQSGNGTFVNDNRIHHHILQPGDLIRFDHIVFRYEDVHFKVDKHGTRVRGDLLAEPEPEAPRVAVSQMTFLPDTAIETPSKRLRRGPPKRGGKFLLVFVLLLTVIILAGLGYGGWLLLQRYVFQPEAGLSVPADAPPQKE